MKFEKTFSPLKTQKTFCYPCLKILLASLIILATISCQQFAGNKTEFAPNSGAEIFKLKCGKCHDVELAMKEYRSAAVWYQTIARMKEEHNADISREEADLLVKYHIARQQQEAAIFKEKCQKCHPGTVFFAEEAQRKSGQGYYKDHAAEGWKHDRRARH